MALQRPSPLKVLNYQHIRWIFIFYPRISRIVDLYLFIYHVTDITLEICDNRTQGHHNRDIIQNLRF